MFSLGVLSCGPTVSSAPGEAALDDGSTGDEPASETGAAPLGCRDPVALTQPGPEGRASGLQQCADGLRHRVEAVACDPGGWTVGDCVNTWGGPSDCMSDAECVSAEGAQGLCLDTPEPWDGCHCSYGCASDADCAADEACFCDGPHSRCIPAQCRTDTDCPSGELCGLNELAHGCGGSSLSLSCTTPEDECRADTDCDECLQCLRWLQDDRRTCSASTGLCTPCG